MNPSKLRRQIAFQAARLMYERQETEYFSAKQKAARMVFRGWVKPKDLPSNAEIREEVQLLAQMLEGHTRPERLLEMRIEAVSIMRILDDFSTFLIGSVLTGHVRSGSDIDIHVFSDSIMRVAAVLDQHGLKYSIEEKRIVKNKQKQLYQHIHILDRFDVELTVYPRSKSGTKFISSITLKPIEKASLRELETLIETEYHGIDVDESVEQAAGMVDRFQIFQVLLLPLENVKQNPAYHPEGDALYHSLQVFELACNQRPYDEEFLLAALLHDVGKAIDPFDHVAAGVKELVEFATDRTLWLIKHHMLAHQIHERTIGARALRRLQSNENFDDLVLLGECDRAGRKCGIEVPDLDDALDYIRSIETMFD